jgi:uncharacterized phage protein (TIGR01671 family)
MRQIKFRAWDELHKIMLSRHDGYSSEVDVLEEAPRYMQENGFTLMQFTGLHDKNDKEIFEGDILRVHSLDKDHDGQLMVVGWGKLGWTVKSKNWYSLTDHDKFSVVGNIYENPGLL